MSKKSGIVNIIKPPGMTSFAVTKWMKKLFDVKKAGHTGTLDLLASGVLPVCLGRATKIIPFLPESTKEYIGELTLGIETETCDKEGKIIKKNSRWCNLERKLVEKVFENFKGESEQIPPMYSAVQKNGKRLYKLARSGKRIDREPRKIFIHKLEIINYQLPVIKFKVVCSRGTYIRSLTRDIGRALKTGAVLTFLIRTVSGPFTLERAITGEELFNINKNKRNNMLLPMDQPLTYPELILKDSSHKRAINGACLAPEDFVNWSHKLEFGDKVTIYDNYNNFISIYEVTADKEGIICKPRRVFV